ncbi:MAG: glycine--tRNA ligase subunit beta [bacterium]|nr:glycine--tRNA ligase subunit beta [bacterium]
MADFLLEVRTEEIPANALPAARTQLESAFTARMNEAGFEDFTVSVRSTARRLIVAMGDLPKRQADRTEEVSGPPVSVAFSESGEPTKAAEGFARKVGVPVTELGRITTDKGEYLAATVTHAGRPAAEILAEMIPPIFSSLRFPKMMRWGCGEQVFVRPVHGVLALLDDQPVTLQLFGVDSTARTVGHRVHAPVEAEVTSAGTYEDAMRQRSVLVDPAERKEILERRAEELAREVGCRVHPDEALVAEHVELVEYPGLERGEIDEAFLELPPEVEVTTLRHHQKCLILEREDGALAPYFLAVVDRLDDPEGLVRQGNEWVIGARLADAGFFFAEDRKRRLESLISGLDRLEFHRKLGTLQSKALRTARLAEWFAAQVGIDLPAADLERAAQLIKTDLLTNMVGEFPELQGVMGGHYLRLEGEHESLWTAARDHYQPQGFAGRLPESDLGRLLGCSDRLDTLAGLFAVGEVPKGSRDPLGLRRAAQAVVRMLAESDWTVDIKAAIAQAVDFASAAVECDGQATTDAVTEFVSDRVRRYLMQRHGIAFDTADAVMAAGWNVLPPLVARATALEKVRRLPEFRMLAQAFKRVINITDDQPEGTVNTDLFEHKEEKELNEATRQFSQTLAECLESQRIDDAFLAMGPVADVLDRFFIEVLVMSEDKHKQQNRIALLKELRGSFLTLADLSKLQVEGG